METHGVEADRIAAPITQDMIQPVKPAGAFTRNVLNVVPFLALGLAYAATQYAAQLKVRAVSVQPFPLPFHSGTTAASTGMNTLSSIKSDSACKFKSQERVSIQPGTSLRSRLCVLVLVADCCYVAPRCLS